MERSAADDPEWACGKKRFSPPRAAWTAVGLWGKQAAKRQAGDAQV
jgi:hypothetical protein